MVGQQRPIGQDEQSLRLVVRRRKVEDDIGSPLQLMGSFESSSKGEFLRLTDLFGFEADAGPAARPQL